MLRAVFHNNYLQQDQTYEAEIALTVEKEQVYLQPPEVFAVLEKIQWYLLIPTLCFRNKSRHLYGRVVKNRKMDSATFFTSCFFLFFFVFSFSSLLSYINQRMFP